MISFTEFLSRAIEIPFKEKGRSWDGVDCWGLVVLAFKEVKGIKLPLHVDGYSSTRRLRELNSLIDERKSESWVSISDPKPMDCVLINNLGIASHVGLIIDEKRNFIHVESKRMTSVTNVNNPLYKGPGYSHIEGFYRYV